MDYLKIRSKATQFVTLTSLTLEEFDYLLPVFEKELKWRYRKTSRGQLRLNKFTWRPELPSAGHHLFFVLTYLKENPTQTFHGAIFNISQETVSAIIKDSLSALNQTLRQKKFLPCANGEDYAEFVKSLKSRFASNPQVRIGDNLMDATEVRIQRPVNEKDQEDTYSGKKKTHTVKNLIISLFCGYITFASTHFVGRIADKKSADSETIHFIKGTYLWTDLGFKGYKNEDVSVIIPHKKPKNGDLTQEQMDENQMIASFRIRNEHAIGGMKRCRIMKEVIRIHDFEKRDIIFATCAGLHNLRTVFRNI